MTWTDVRPLISIAILSEQPNPDMMNYPLIIYMLNMVCAKSVLDDDHHRDFLPSTGCLN